MLITLFVPSVLTAQTLLSDIEVVGGRSAPVTLTLSVASAGDYTLQLSDLGFPALEPGIEAFSSLDGLLVESGTEEVVGSVALGTALAFTASAATSYELTVVGQLTNGGLAALFAGNVTDAVGGDEATVFGSLLAPIEPVLSSTLLEPVSVVDAGTYTLRVEDFRFPSSLGALEVLLIGEDGSELARLDATGANGARTQTVSLSPGTTVDLAVFTAPGAGLESGLFGVELRGGPFGDALFIRSVPVSTPQGTRLSVTPFEVPEGTGGTHTIALTDFVFPAPLGGLSALVVRDGQVVARLQDQMPPSTADFQAGVAAYQLFVDAQPDALAGTGSFGATISNSSSSNVIVDLLATVEDAAAEEVPSIAFSVPDAGNYSLEVVDFGFPELAQSLTVLLLEGTGLIVTLDGPGAVSFSADGPESYTLLLTGEPEPGGALIGVSVTDADGESLLAERTIALGAEFSSQTFEITQAQRLEATVTDLSFPTALTELRTALTRGADVIGDLDGSGTLAVAADPGIYTLSVVSIPAEGAFGSFASQVVVAQGGDTAPPPPVDEPPESGQRGGGGSTSVFINLLLLVGLGARRHLGARERSPAL